jgi:rod shape-determining protein MreC
VNRRRVLRRRIVVAVLLLLSIAMLTLYFRESDSGVVHGVQGGVLTVVEPLQNGASRALKPARDGWNWVGDLFGAKSENARLERELQELRAAVADQLVLQAENQQLRELLKLDDAVFPRGVQLVTARVVARSTTAWYSTVTINVGSADGVRVYDPVVNGDGLVGRVSDVTGSSAQVELITDQGPGVAAMTLPGGARGIVQGSATGDVTMEYVDKSEKVKVGQFIVTSGLWDSIYVKGIPIGQVESVGSQEVELYQSVAVDPAVDFRKLDVVQVVVR